MESVRKYFQLEKRYWTLTFGNLFASEGRLLKGPHSCSSVLSETADGEGVFVLENTWRQAKGHSLIGWWQAYESPSEAQSPHLEHLLIGCAVLSLLTLLRHSLILRLKVNQILPSIV